MDNDQIICLDTEDQIADAGGFILGLRYALDEGHELTLDAQHRVLAIAYTALLRLKPAALSTWTDTSAGPVPDWLRNLQGSEEQR